MSAIYKAKSLSDKYTNIQIADKCSTTRFIYFESAIQLFRLQYDLTDLEHTPIGYRVTEQGIEILFE